MPFAKPPEPPQPAAKPLPHRQFWAMQTANGMLAMLSAGGTRDTARVIECHHGYGFVLDVYPDEVERYERDFARRKALVLGKFATVAEAYAHLDRWARGTPEAS